MNKESWEVQLLNASYFQLLSFHQQYYENERCPELNDLEADEMGSVFLHLRSGVPVTRSLQIQSPLIPTVEKMAPSENVQEIEAGATSTAREGDIASSNGVRYGECRKNHAASIGGYAVDGCTEFMASGDEGTAATMICAACNCHRSFHRREVENETLCEHHRIRR